MRSGLKQTKKYVKGNAIGQLSTTEVFSKHMNKKIIGLIFNFRATFGHALDVLREQSSRFLIKKKIQKRK